MKETAIDNLFRLYYRPLCMYAARYLRDADAIEDIVQGAFIAYWEKAKIGKEPDTSKSYLYRIVHNRCIDALRKGGQDATIDLEHLKEDVPDEETVDRSVGWSEASQSWFIEDELATDREDRADGFNLTGKTFTKSRTQEALSQFPDVVGKPLHYKYIRFSGKSLQSNEAFAISGDFSGPHYGDAQPGIVIQMEKSDKMFAEAAGQPYDNIFTTGHAGYVNFKFVSDEYDHYLKDVAEYELLYDIGNDIVGIYSNTNIYTNIQGGIGIFGAEVDNKLYWSCGVWSY